MRISPVLVALLAGLALAQPAAARGHDSSCIDRAALQQSLASQELSLASLSPEVLETALTKVEQFGCPSGGRSVIVLVDFDLPSASPRLWLVDLRTGAGLDRPLHVAHGRGSDPADTGFADYFGNDDGSRRTSLGLFRGGNRYTGVHGPSLRLFGREATNSMAFERQIVLHTSAGRGPDYVSREWLASKGKLGMSDGCFVVMQDEYRRIEDALADGGVLVAVSTGERSIIDPVIARKLEHLSDVAASRPAFDDQSLPEIASLSHSGRSEKPR